MLDTGYSMPDIDARCVQASSIAHPVSIDPRLKVMIQVSEDFIFNKTYPKSCRYNINTTYTVYDKTHRPMITFMISDVPADGPRIKESRR